SRAPSTRGLTKKSLNRLATIANFASPGCRTPSIVLPGSFTLSSVCQKGRGIVRRAPNQGKELTVHRIPVACTDPQYPLNWFHVFPDHDPQLRRLESLELHQEAYV